MVMTFKLPRPLYHVRVHTDDITSIQHSQTFMQQNIYNIVVLSISSCCFPALFACGPNLEHNVTFRAFMRDSYYYFSNAKFVKATIKIELPAIVFLSTADRASHSSLANGTSGFNPDAQIINIRNPCSLQLEGPTICALSSFS